MSEEMIPDVEITSDVLEVESVSAVNYSEKSLAELIRLFEDLAKSEDRMKLSKEAESIKAAFYKRLAKEKSEAGLTSVDVIPDAVDVEGEEELSKDDAASDNPFSEIEKVFKYIYNEYRKERAEYNRQLEKEREDNLALKETVIAELKALLEKQEDVGEVFPQFRELQDRWRNVGPVPAQNYRNVNDTYQLYVEQFYDMVKINRELRDLDFKKNLEAKEELCEMAESLTQKEDVIEAFRELQKLHEQWKDYGPVAKEQRESIWDRFKVATSVINKRYQSHFESLKEQYAENLAKKSSLCQVAEEIAERDASDLNQWNAYTKEIEELQQEWKTIGFASKKDNQKVYERFRAACDKFYGRKREFYLEYKDGMNENLEKKIAICEEAERLKLSTDWKKATDQFINLQKQWKEIGAVPRKKSEQLWKRFRAACDEFFAERDKNAKPENDFYGNFKAKTRLIEEINAYQLAGDASDAAVMAEFQNRWNAIGFVPYKEKENVSKAYRQAMAKFQSVNRSARKSAKPQMSERDRLVQRYHALEQDVATYENNIGFFSMSKNSEPLIMQMQQRIQQAKEELASLAEQIKKLDNETEQK